MKKLLGATALCLVSWQAEAACVSPLTGLDGGSTSRTFGVTLDAGTNCYGNVALVDGANAANKVTVKAASTAAVAADQALVVAVSPNNTVAVTGTVTSNQGSPPWQTIVVGGGNQASVNASGQLFSRIVGNAGAVLDLVGQNASTAAINSVLVAGQFNTTPTTIASGSGSPLQLDSAGNLLVNIKAGAGSGGTAMTDNTAFTQGTTSFTPIGCINPASLVSIPAGDAGAVLCTLDRHLYVNLNKVANTSLGTPATYGTTPTGTALSANVFVTNALASVNDNGDAVAVATPFGTPVVNHPYVFNGTTYDRTRSGGVTGMAGVTAQATPSGGATETGNIVPTAAPVAVVIKASAGTLYGAQLYNIGSGPAYLKLYNATTATCGSGTPIMRLMIPAAATAANGAGSNIASFPGINFGTGITYCATGGLPDADTTAIASNTVLINLQWQ